MYNIIFEDSDLVVVNKPAGLLCVPGLSDPANLFDQVKTNFPSARVVHRLDMATSGLVIFALNHPTQKALGQQFEHRQVQKKYLSVVAGIIQEAAGEIHSPMLCDWDRRPIQKIDWLTGKQASTHYRVLSRNPTDNTTRVQLAPHTGRTHQLRLHMLQLGSPILGDNFYFLNGSNNAAPRLLLHAQALTFTHPSDGAKLQLNCPAAF